MLRLLLLTSMTTVCRSHFSVIPTTSIARTMSMRAIDFEVFGKVQGVFFRKYTKQEADKLGLKGWCLNTSKGTVLGHMQGPSEKIEAMTNWLKNTGSPSSRIEKAEFRNSKEITSLGFENFEIRKDL